MSADGVNMISLFRQARQICEQVSLLLRTSDEQMKKANWRSDFNNNAIADVSYSIFKPQQWIPISAFRFYANENTPSTLACISVLFGDHFEERYTLKEPIISAAIFEYETDAKKEFDNEYWLARYFGYLSKSKHLEPNGEIVYFDNKKLEQDLQVSFKKGLLFALPLVTLKNAHDVKEQVTDRLKNLLLANQVDRH